LKQVDKEKAAGLLALPAFYYELAPSQFDISTVRKSARKAAALLAASLDALGAGRAHLLLLADLEAEGAAMLGFHCGAR
jgi:hypothetical protein